MSSGAMLKVSSLNWVQKLKNGLAAGFLSFCLVRCGSFTVPIHRPTLTKARWLQFANGWNNTESNHERHDC